MSTVDVLPIQTASSRGFDFASRDGQFLFVKIVRIACLAVILLGVLLNQVGDRHFIPASVLIPIYCLLAVTFLVNSAYLLRFESLKNHLIFTVLLHLVDTVMIAGLYYFLGSNQALILFLFLLNISLGGWLYGRQGAYMLAMVTSILFSLLLVVGPAAEKSNVILALTLNNFAFFAVAGLSGYLAEQFLVLGQEIETQSKEIESLIKLNDMIVSNIGTGLMTIGLNGDVTHCNRAAMKILSTSHLNGMKLSNIFPKIHSHLGEMQEDSIRTEVAYENPSGENAVIEVIVSPLFDANRNPRGHVLLMQDLTEIKRLEFQLRQKEKLAAVGQLAAGIAHEIRNPLASISGSIQLLLTTYQPENDENRKLMNIVLREIDRLNNLIGEFLEFVRPDERNFTPININGLLQEVLEIVKVNDSLRSEIEQKANLKSHKIIMGDYNKLKQATLNIVINAYQAMDQNLKPEIQISTYDKSQSVVVMIKDNGVGIEAENLAKIFEPFHTTKAQGTGLGLAITHKILENHKARVFVDSEKGRGTVFTIEFPSANDSDQDQMAAKVRA